MSDSRPSAINPRSASRSSFGTLLASRPKLHTISRRSHNITIRNPAFLQRVRGIKRNHILGVAVDVAKDFHKVLIFDFNSKILKHPFAIDVFETGYRQFKVTVDRYAKRIQAKRVFIGVELSGSYGQSFVRRAHEDFQDILFIQGSATASNRLQKRLVGLKTDDVDICSISDLLIRGEGTPYSLREGVYLQLRELAYWCYGKKSALRRLKQQILHRMERVYPGLMSRFNGNRPVMRRTFHTGVSRGLMALGLSPHDLRQETTTSLIQHMARLGYAAYPEQTRRLQAYLKRMTWTDQEVAKAQLGPLKRDVRLLEALEEELEAAQEEMVGLVHQTPATILLGQIKGVTDLAVASYIGLIGDYDQYRSASQIYSLSGLAPKVAESGKTKFRRLGIKRAGNRALRYNLYVMAMLAAKHDPYFRAYYTRYRETHQAAHVPAVIATANKLNRVLVALLRDQTPFRREMQTEGPPGISEAGVSANARSND